MPKIFSLLVGREIEVDEAEYARRRAGPQQAPERASASRLADLADGLAELMDSRRALRDAGDRAEQAHAEAAAAVTQARELREELAKLRASPAAVPGSLTATQEGAEPAPIVGERRLRIERRDDGLLLRVHDDDYGLRFEVQRDELRRISGVVVKAST